MNLLERDLFELWRWTLAVGLTIYAAVMFLRWLWSWLVFLNEPRRERMLMRRYIVLHLLRLRGARFRSEVVQILLYLVAILIVYGLHDYV